MKRQTRAERIVDALKLANVPCVFGLPGSQMLELFEALRRSQLRTITTTSELAAAFMAGGWARITGDPGVIVTMAGPGFMWALNGIAEARLDSVPLVHISGVVGASPAGRRFRQQDLAQRDIAAPLVKQVIDAAAYSDPGVAVLEALRVARSGEPGPVLLQVSQPMLAGDLRESGVDLSVAPPQDSAGLNAVCARVQGARRPVFIVGDGASPHSRMVREVVERLKCPLLTTPSARGLLPEDHPLNFGFDPFGENVSEINELIDSCDAVFAIGCKLSHSGTFGFELRLPAARLVQLDASPEIVGANYSPSLAVVAGAGDLFQALVALPLAHSDWTVEELAQWRVLLKARPAVGREPRIAGTPAGEPAAFFKALRRALPPEAILVLDSGLHQMLARRYFQVESPQGLLMPTDLQSMGFAIPTAIGARLAAPNRPVVALVGDGGFAMTALDLLTAAREGISLTVIVFVDGAFGQIRMQQLSDYGASHGVLLQNPDFRLLAGAVGAHYELAGEDDIAAIVRRALMATGVTVVEVAVGDTLEILRRAVVARLREGTRRLAGPGLFQRIRKWVKRSA